MAGVLPGADGTPLAGPSAGWIAVCQCGPAHEGERLLAPIKACGPPVVDTIGPTSYAAMQTMFDAGSPAGRRNYWKSNFLGALSDAAIDAIVARADGLPKPGSLFLLEHLQGAAGRVDEHATAFSNRNAKYNASVLRS